MKVSHQEGLKTENAILSKHSSFLNGNLQINVFLSVLYSIKCCVLSITLVLVQLVASAASQYFSLYFLLCLLTSFTT